MKHFSLALVFHILLLAKGFSEPYLENINQDHAEDPGSLLILTPYIKSGQIEEARNLSRVEFPGFPEVKSYAGFFTVDPTYNSNQFLWYFPAKNTKEEAVILWLQGGPGGSSLFGLFAENGPFQVKNGSFHQRDIHWAKDHHLIYIDNPVGTGFSFTNDSRGYCTNQTQIGEHLYTTLIQFFQLFPELQKIPFFISGESYGGKYVPALGYTIHKKNPTAKIKINMKGLLIGNGWSDPINQLDYGDYLYQIGLIDFNQKKKTEVLQNRLTQLIKAETWLHATEFTFDELYSYINNCIGTISLLSYLPTKLDSTDNPFPDLIQTVSIRRAIHVGNLTFNNVNVEVFNALKEDVMKSVAPWISELLEHYHIMFYNGQVDINVAYPLTVNFLRKLKFSARDEYLKASRSMLYIAKNNYVEQVAFLKNAGKLTEVLIRDAGHMVPADQPEWIYNLIIWWRQNVVRFDGDKSIDGKVILNSTY